MSITRKNTLVGSIKAGAKYGRWTAIKPEKRDYYWCFKCECGSEKSVHIFSVLKGKSNSCGCLRKEINAGATHLVTHGATAKGETKRIYRIYRGILGRCNYESSPSYKNYGGKGIECLWDSFESFYADMSASYESHVEKHGEKNTQIDRIDNNGHYSKENCRWATLKQQCRTRSNTVTVVFRGELLPVSEVAEKFGMTRKLLYGRIFKLGWDIEKAVSTPVRAKTRHF